MIAKREQPDLDLPPLIECNSCWIGKTSNSKIRVYNRGGHAAFWLSNSQNLDSESALSSKPEDFDNPEAFISNEFVIYPDKFILSKNEYIEMEIEFVPNKEGVSKSKIWLNCDNMKTYEYELIAEANMIELVVTEIDSVSLINDEFKSLDMIYFLDNEYLSPKKRILSVENLTKNDIEYEWKFQNSDQKCFEIYDQNGIFENREIKNFEILFKANDFITNYEKLELIIKNIPLKSVKNPPIHIQEMIKRIERDKLRGKEVNENENVEFTYFTFDLMGQVKPVEYSIEPSLIYFPFEIPIKIPQTSVFRIINNSNAPGEFKITLVSKSNDKVKCEIKDIVRKIEKIIENVESKEEDESEKRGRRRYKKKMVIKRPPKKKRLESGKSEKTQASPKKSSKVAKNKSGLENEINDKSKVNESNITNEDMNQQYEYISIKRDKESSYYTISPLEELEIFIEYSSDIPLKNQKFIFKVDYENAASKYFQVIADFKGPTMRFCQPEINFGIVQTYNKLEQTFLVENVSDVDAEVIIRKKQDKLLDFDLWDEAIENDEVCNIEYLFNTGKLRIFPFYIKIPRGEKREIKVEFHAEEAESFENVIEMLPKHGESVMCSIFSEVQEPIICLNRSTLSYPTLYANKVYAIKSSLDPHCIVLRNLGNIGSNFEFFEVNNEDVIQSAIQPKSGFIEPKSEIMIKFKFLVKLFGKFKFYFRCNIDVLDMPIGFELITHVFGLEIAYELTPEVGNVSLMRKKMMKKMKRDDRMSDAVSMKSNAKTVIYYLIK